jgi:hypothetical protein
MQKIKAKLCAVSVSFAHDKTVIFVLIMVWLVSVNTMSDLVAMTCLDVCLQRGEA